MSCSIQNVEVLFVDDHGDKDVSDGKEEQDDDGEDHLHVGVGGEPKDTEDGQLAQLEESESVNRALWHTPDVVRGRVGALLGEEQGDPLKHLVAVEGRHRQVEEQAVQHWRRDVVQHVLHEQHRQADQNVAEIFF